jgi:hypothetical protein
MSQLQPKVSVRNSNRDRRGARTLVQPGHGIHEFER